MEWRLHLEVVQAIWQQYSREEVDLFTLHTTHCPLWFSLEETTSPLGQDALSCEWPQQLLYAFPLLPLIQTGPSQDLPGGPHAATGSSQMALHPGLCCSNICQTQQGGWGHRGLPHSGDTFSEGDTATQAPSVESNTFLGPTTGVGGAVPEPI